MVRPISVCFALIVFCFGLATYADDNAENANQDTQNSENTTENPSAHAKPPITVQIIESDDEAERRERREDESDKREIQDLAAQQSMDVSAKEMNIATQKMRKYTLLSTIFGFIFGLLGLGGLLYTLYLTRKSVRQTQKIMKLQFAPIVNASIYPVILQIRDKANPIYIITTYIKCDLTETNLHNFRCIFFLVVANTNGRETKSIGDNDGYLSETGGINFDTGRIEFEMDSTTWEKLFSKKSVLEIRVNYTFNDLFGERINGNFLFQARLEDAEPELSDLHGGVGTVIHYRTFRRIE